MPKYFDLSAIKRAIPDYAHSGDPPCSSDYAQAMLSELDTPHDGIPDGEHVVECFDDALAGILDGLALRIAPTQMRSVVDHLMQHASFTMRWKAQIEDDCHGTDEAKRQDEIDLLGFEGGEAFAEFLGRATRRA